MVNQKIISFINVNRTACFNDIRQEFKDINPEELLKELEWMIKGGILFEKSPEVYKLVKPFESMFLDTDTTICPNCGMEYNEIPGITYSFNPETGRETKTGRGYCRACGGDLRW